MNLTFVGTILVLQKQKKDLFTVKNPDILLIDPLDSVMFKVYKLLGIAVGKFTGDLHFTTIFLFGNESVKTFNFFSQMKKWDIVGPNKRAMSDIEIPTPFSVYKTPCRKRKF